MAKTRARCASWRVWITALVGLAACAPAPPPSGGPDSTPPLLELASAGLPKDVWLTQDSSAPETHRARSTDSVLLVATATDAESGVRGVAIQGEIQVECIPSASNRIVRIVDPITQTNRVASGQASLSSKLTVSFVIGIGSQRARCPSGSTFYQLHATLHAEAENGAGHKRSLPDAIVRSFGPDSVRVATFNMYNPGKHPDHVFERWGRTAASQADVIFLQEGPDLRRVQLVAYTAGMPYVVYDVNTAVASRRPIRNVVRRNVSGSIIISGVTDLGGYPHQIVGVHLAPAQNPELSSPLRVAAATEAMALLALPPAIVIMGGDFNAYSGVGPQRQPGSTTEMDLLRGRLMDVFSALGLSDDDHCSDQRIDYLLVQGPYIPTKYEACSGPRIA